MAARRELRSTTVMLALAILPLVASKVLLPRIVIQMVDSDDDDEDEKANAFMETLVLYSNLAAMARIQRCCCCNRYSQVTCCGLCELSVSTTI